MASSVEFLAIGLKQIKEGFETLQRAEPSYSMDCLLNAREQLLTRYSPFKVGDRVQLVEDVKLDRGSGWYHCRHFLKAGFTATVHSVSIANSGGLRFDLIFDDESWIDANGVVRPVPACNRHTMTFSENNIMLSGTKQKVATIDAALQQLVAAQELLKGL